MKKICSILICFFLVCSLAACEAENIIVKIKTFNLVEYMTERVDWDSKVIEELKTGGRYKYYFNRLSNKEKQAYNNVLSVIENLPESVAVPYLNPEELTAVFEALLYDNPSLFFLGRGCTTATNGLSVQFVPQYTMDAAEYNRRSRLLTQKAEEILSKTADKDPFEKELFFHDYIIENCAYAFNSTPDEGTAYGALVNGKASCEGYSKAMQLLSDMAEIDCFIITGVASGPGGNENHMWNIVGLDGDFYHLDVTWDDPVSPESGENGDDPIYTYFNITDEEIKITHSQFFKDIVCSSQKENYFTKKGLLFNSFNNSEKAKIVALVKSALDTGRKSVEFKFSDQNVYNKALSSLFINGDIYTIMRKVNTLSSGENSIESLSYIRKDDFKILELNLIFE